MWIWSCSVSWIPVRTNVFLENSSATQWTLLPLFCGPLCLNFGLTCNFRLNTDTPGAGRKFPVASELRTHHSARLYHRERGEGQLLLLWMECKQTDSPKYRFQFWAALAGWLSQHSERWSHGSVLCHAAGLWTDSRLINLKVQSQCEGWEGAGGLSKSPAVCGAKVKYANVQILKAWQMVKMSPCSHSYSVVDSWSGRRCSCWCFSVAQ